MYLLLPETEERTLEDIEMHFSDNKRKITDRQIEKNVVVRSFQDANVAVIECDKQNKEFAKTQSNEKNKLESSESIARKTPSAHTNVAFVSDD